MPKYSRTVLPRRSRRIVTSVGAVALLASASLLGCEQSDRVDTPRDAEPASPRAGEPMGEPAEREPMVDPAERGPSDRPEGTAMRPATRPYDEPSLGGRPGAPGTTPGSDPGAQTMTAPQAIEKTASVDMRTFEQRFESELGDRDLTLAAAFDLEGETKMRMFVVAPKELGEQGTQRGGGTQQGGETQRGGGMQQGGGMQPGGDMDPGGTGGDMPSPQYGGMKEAAGEPHEHPSPSAIGAAGDGSTSAKAQMALQTSRLVVAYADPERPDRVTIAYLRMPAQPGQPDREQKLRDAIDRATEGETEAETPPEERRG